MSIPKYRYVQYTDDGCDRYECLNCYCCYEFRHIPMNFCPGCGIKYSKHECREKYIPKWLYKLFGSYDNQDFETSQKCQKIRERFYELNKLKRKRLWAIQKKVTHYEDDKITRIDDWSTFKYGDDNCSVRQVYYELYYLRQNELADRSHDDDFCWYSKEEYRAILVDKDKAASYKNLSCYNKMSLMEILGKMKEIK